jgi:hypothetical protein
MLGGNARETLADVRQDAVPALQTGDSLTGRYERLKVLRKNAPLAFAYWCIAASYGI